MTTESLSHLYRVTIGDFTTHLGATTMNHTSSPATCTVCGTTQRLSLIIHNVRYRPHNRHLCTDCLLKNHQGLFCPICYQVYDHSPPPHQRLMCLRCPSIAHRSCAFPFSSTTTNADSVPVFLCPTCADPKFSYFNLSAADRISRTVDDESLKVLSAASRIAAVSMTKGAAVARFEAEWRAKEAVVSRKRAMEAMEEFVTIQTKEEEEEEENGSCIVDLNSRLHVTEE